MGSLKTPPKKIKIYEAKMSLYEFWFLFITGYRLLFPEYQHNYNGKCDILLILYNSSIKNKVNVR